jgi:hypothetical protein
MIGSIIVGAVGLVLVGRAIRRHRHYRHAFFQGQFGGGGPWSGPRGRGGPLSTLFARLDTTPGQEKVIVAAIDEARSALRDSRGELRASRDDVAKALASDAFDETLLGMTFARQDETLANVRRAFTGALAKIHEALDPRQRGILSNVIAHGPAAFGSPFGAVHV